MRAHEHEVEDPGSLRPKPARLDSPELSHVLRAGATGVLGLQRMVGNGGVGAMLEEDRAQPEERSPVHDVVGSGGGQPLDPATREDMEGRLGHDFGDDRVHTDSAAHDSAAAVNAHAYTVGSNVVFQRDRYDPEAT